MGFLNLEVQGKKGKKEGALLYHSTFSLFFVIRHNFNYIVVCEICAVTPPPSLLLNESCDVTEPGAVLLHRDQTFRHSVPVV